jgi:alkane 1-monooxygenase
MKASIRLFAIAALAPVPLIGLGALFGGLWVWAALGYITLLAFSLDQLAAIAQNPAAPDAEFPAADRLSVVLALGHFALLILAILGLSGATGLGFGERFALFMGAGLFFGQISNSNAHELIHRGNRALHRLGMWVYISLLFGHHTSAHPLVHHRYVASPQDPNSARPGESFYRFAPRAWIGSFRAGYRAENARLARVERHAFWQNPYALYIGGAAGIALLVFAATGPAGLLAYIALAAYAQMQLLLSDYVQHYGLNRAEVNGKLEPVGPLSKPDPAPRRADAAQIIARNGNARALSKPLAARHGPACKGPPRAPNALSHLRANSPIHTAHRPPPCLRAMTAHINHSLQILWKFETV